VDWGLLALGPRLRLLASQPRLRAPDGSLRHPLSLLRPPPAARPPVARGAERAISGYFGGAWEWPPPPPPPARAPKAKRPRAAGKPAAPRRAPGPPGPAPPWQALDGLPFVVDGFSGPARHCQPAAWLLTHFHSDHYAGLGPRWASGAPIVCTPATAALVRLRLRPPPDLLLELPLGQRRCIAGVHVTLFDANHCPGAAMALFEPAEGPPTLHTGDCRWDAAKMAAALGPALQALGPAKRAALRLVLDTTYCDPAAAFPPAGEAAAFVAAAVRAEAFNSARTLFLVGSYTIGKERVAFAAARAAGSRLYAGAAKRAVLDCLPLAPDEAALLTGDDASSNVHIVPMACVAFARMAGILRHYKARYDTVVGFAPTGWAFGRAAGRAGGARTKRGSLVRYDVPYSEHSSFAELRAAVDYLRPAAICPSVGNDMGQGAARQVRLLTAHEDSPELRVPRAPLRKPRGGGRGQ